jgi:SAM-dependent methyltransferase
MTYAESFGFQWTIHSKTQRDSYSGTSLSRTRFFRETGWPERMEGELILEVGCGSGRFTEQAVSTGARVVATDYSRAVFVNDLTPLRSQCSVFELPFMHQTFDRIFCFGVLQHTPDPEEAFKSMIPLLKPGGSIVVDVYDRRGWYLQTKYYVRWLTKRVSPEKLYRWCRRWIDVMWPVASLIRRIPRIGRAINWRLLVSDYSRSGLTGPLLKEWAYLDTFDMLSPSYDKPQRIEDVRRWFRQAGLTDVEVRYGYNGIEGRGKARQR